MRRCYDGRRTRWIDRFLRDFRTAAKKANPDLVGRDLDEFGLVTSAILQEITGGDWAAGNFGGHYIAAGLLADNLAVSTKTIRRHLRAIARAGMILGVSAYDADKGRRLPLEIIINPVVRDALNANLGVKPVAQIADVLAGLWLERRAYDGEVQGFDETILPWGKAHLGTGSSVQGAMPAPSSKLAGRIKTAMDEAKEGRRLDNKARRREEAAVQRAKRDAFVTGAAIVWRELRARAGFGNEPPGWSGDRNALPDPQRKERAILEKVFERYGGRKAAYAWALFCGGKPAKDEKGRLAFVPELAHRQWTTPDKKPSHFAKHIDLVLAEMSQSKWDQDADLGHRLGAVFGETFEMEARNAPVLPEYKSARPKSQEVIANADSQTAPTPGW